jgi:hypothetical protein
MVGDVARRTGHRRGRERSHLLPLSLRRGVRGGGERSASVYPPTLADRVAALVKRPGDLSPADLATYVQVDAAAFARPFDFDDPLAHFKWALATAESYRAIAEDLWRTDRPDLLMAYIEGTDSTSHLFGHLFRAEGYPPGAPYDQGAVFEFMFPAKDPIVGSPPRRATWR